jgi:hypothetical protein
MTERQTQTDHPDGGWYEIRVAGALGGRWAAWFDGMTVSVDRDGTTVIAGPVADQAGLHGLLQRVRDLGVPLVSLARIDSRHTASARPATPSASRTTGEPG